MVPEQEYSLVELTKEESESFSKDLEAVIIKHSVHFQAIPKIVTQSINGPFTLDGEFFAMKKVLKAQKSVESPYANSEEKPDASSEKSGEGDSGKSA